MAVALAREASYDRKQLVRLTVRVEDANLAPEERGLRLYTWSSVWRRDPGRESEVDVPLPLARTDRSSGELELGLVVPAGYGSRGNPWPADAVMWIGAATYAPSEEGPLVGGRAGCAAVSLADLRARLAPSASSRTTEAHSILLKLRMSQPGIPGKGRYRKMNVRLLRLSTDTSRDVVRGWSMRAKSGPNDFVEATMARHDDLLDEYVSVQMFPYSDTAEKMGVFFEPSHKAVTPIHAPLWIGNVVVPGFAYWMQIGKPSFDDAMTNFMKAAAEATLARHDWPRGIPGAPQGKSARDAFTAVVNGQFLETGQAYNETFTYACAALSDMCGILAVSLFYRYDEVYRVDSHWFGDPTVRKAQTENFQDALRMSGDDCEGLGSLIHRVFRWLQMGDPRRANGAYWQAFGGWDDPVLSAMQHIAYWYVSGGSLGSVTAARFTPMPGASPELIIRSNEDESLPIGGHMWQEAMPVPKFEKLLSRMNPTTKGVRARPEYNGAYPPWIEAMPHLIGEGTGSIYPLVLPLMDYFNSERARALAKEKHANMLSAMRRLEQRTRVLHRMQIERWSDRTETVENARVNYFYRRTTGFSTDDLALRQMPFFDFVWAMTSVRADEKMVGTTGSMLLGASSAGGNPYDDLFVGKNGKPKKAKKAKKPKVNKPKKAKKPKATKPKKAKKPKVNKPKKEKKPKATKPKKAKKPKVEKPKKEKKPKVEKPKKEKKPKVEKPKKEKKPKVEKPKKEKKPKVEKPKKEKKPREERIPRPTPEEPTPGNVKKVRVRKVKKIEDPENPGKYIYVYVTDDDEEEVVVVRSYAGKSYEYEYDDGASASASASFESSSTDDDSYDQAYTGNAISYDETSESESDTSSAEQTYGSSLIGYSAYSSASESYSETSSSSEEDTVDTTHFGDNIGVIPGGRSTILGQPRRGVNMRDKVMSVNASVAKGMAHEEVALVAVPPVTDEQMASFMSRIAQLPPWQQPRRSPDARREAEAKFLQPIREFQNEAEAIVREGHARKPPQPNRTSTRVNVIFRRNMFVMDHVQDVALADLRSLAQSGDLERVDTKLEFLDDDVFNVRLSLWMFD